MGLQSGWTFTALLSGCCKLLLQTASASKRKIFEPSSGQKLLLCSQGQETRSGFQHHPQSPVASWVLGGWDGRRWEDPRPARSLSSPASLLLFSFMVAVGNEMGRLGKETALVPPCPPPHYPDLLHCNKLNHSTSLFHI